jgi:hypothetical protein
MLAAIANTAASLPDASSSARFDQLGLAFGDGARLVERHGLELACLFEVGAALDEDAAPRGRCERAHHGDGRRDHQRARARDDQQHQRLVEGLQPRPVHEQRREQRNRQRQHEDRGRVDGGEFIDEALRGRARALRFFDRVNDARERGVGGHGSDAELQCGGLVDGAREDRVAHRLVHRNALARDRRLVDGAEAVGHHAVQRHALAGADARDGVQRHRIGPHGLPAAIGLLHLGLLGREREQALDRVARAVHGAGFDQFGNRIERHHHRGLGPLADDEGARHGDGHQRIDVEAAAHQRAEALLVGVEAGQADGCEREHHLGGHEALAIEGEERDRLGRDGQHQRGDQAREADAHARDACRCGRDGCIAEGLGLEAGLADRIERMGQGKRVGRDGHRAFTEAKAKARDALDRLERAADLGFLDRAIHRGNAKEQGAFGDVGGVHGG